MALSRVVTVLESGKPFTHRSSHRAVDSGAGEIVLDKGRRKSRRSATEKRITRRTSQRPRSKRDRQERSGAEVLGRGGKEGDAARSQRLEAVEIWERMSPETRTEAPKKSAPLFLGGKIGAAKKGAGQVGSDGEAGGGECGDV